MPITLTTLDFINGLFSLLVIIIGAIIGFLISIKYLIHKKKMFLYFGISYIGFYCPWWSSGMSFVFLFISGRPFDIQTYIIINNLFIPFFMILWLRGITEFIYTDIRKVLILLYFVIFLLAESYLIYFIITDISQIGHLSGIFDIKYEFITLYYLLFVNFSVTITGLLFAKHTIRSEKKIVKFQGKALIMAFLTYPICGLIDGGIDLSAIGVIFIRSILIFGAIMFYIGFFVPKVVKKIFNIEE